MLPVARGTEKLALLPFEATVDVVTMAEAEAQLLLLQLPTYYHRLRFGVVPPPLLLLPLLALLVAFGDHMAAPLLVGFVGLLG